jgi:TolB protein
MMASPKKRLFLKTIGATGLLGSLCPIGNALAQLKVEIAGVGANQIPIAIGQFWDDPAGENQITSIVAADLQRSGLFRVIPSNDLVRETGTIDDSFWKSKGADALLGGSLSRADGRIEIRYRLHDTAKGAALAASGLKVNPQFIRLAAHRVADDVFEKMTGIRGPFATRIAYVARSGNEYRLEIADSDGENAFAAFRDTEPVISPAWSPDGSKIAYVSFGPKKATVFVQELATRQRIAVANFKGSNSAPAWSPDGRRLAIALARDGLTHIHMVNADGTDLRRISAGDWIDTEPCFAPDGETIYFTSDRSGSPQIYRMSQSGGEVRRVTDKHGNYNISPAISPDGKLLSYISRRDKLFRVYVLELANGQESRLSDGPIDESPSFAPNSRYIMYASKSGGRANLSVVAVDGSARYTLNAKASTIREPAWGPFTK